MSRNWFTTALIVALVGVVGCGGSGSSSEQATSTPQTQVETATPGDQAAPAVDAAGEAVAEAASVSLQGTLGCGHCTHSIGSSCSAAVQTADGKVYILEGMAAGSEPFDQRFSQKQIKVEGAVTEVDGVAYVKVASFELL